MASCVSLDNNLLLRPLSLSFEFRFVSSISILLLPFGLESTRVHIKTT